MIINADYHRTVIYNIFLVFFVRFAVTFSLLDTHEDIHAFFGMLAQFIRLRDAYDIDGN